jgi:hypothetical protein
MPGFPLQQQNRMQSLPMNERDLILQTGHEPVLVLRTAGYFIFMFCAPVFLSGRTAALRNNRPI